MPPTCSPNQTPARPPFLVEDLLVDGAMAQLVGHPKQGKTWCLLDLAIAVASGEKALGRFEVARPGPVLLVLEESGRAALHRRLDRLARGRAIERERLSELHIATNRRVQLTDEEWRNRLRASCMHAAWRLIALDPWARVAGALDENAQKDVGPVLDFLRELRDLSGATILYVAHTPHEGERQRGSSDFESYYESKLTLAAKSEKRTLSADHREAEAAGPFEITFRFDGETRTVRIDADESELARASLHRWFKRCLERAGLSPSVKLHELRHSAADNLWRSSGNLLLAQQLLRHESVATTQLYLHPTRDDLTDALARMQVVRLEETECES